MREFFSTMTHDMTTLPITAYRRAKRNNKQGKRLVFDQLTWKRVLATYARTVCQKVKL